MIVVEKIDRNLSFEKVVIEVDNKDVDAINKKTNSIIWRY